MRRLVWSLIGTAMLLASVLAMVVVPAPAYADGPPLAQLTAIVNPPPQPDGLLNLCVTSRSLDPSGTCIDIPPSGGGISAPVQSYGTASVYFPPPKFGAQEIVLYFDGRITIGGKTFTGLAEGADAAPGVDGQLAPFTLSGGSPTGSLTATCSGEFESAALAVFSRLGCDGSANGGPVGHVTLVAVYASSQGPFVGY